jgi:hypothetical protein
MSGYWELWDIEAGNLLADFDTESDALVLVHELIAKGWDASNLSLAFEDPDLDVDDLPPGVTGVELARRAEDDGAGPVRRTA